MPDNAPRKPHGVIPISSTALCCVSLRTCQAAAEYGTISAMKVAIDSAGRLVIPKEIRREVHLKPGDRLEVRCRDGRIELEPAPLAVRLVRKGELLVAVPLAGVNKLTRETVEETRRSLRAERGEKARK